MPTKEDIIFKYAVKNAMEYGVADVGSVFSKAIHEFPDSKSDLKGLKSLVESIVKRVNALTKEELQSEYAKYGTEFEDEYLEKAKRTAKPEMVIKDAIDGEVVTRFPPEPGGYIHIGNAKQCILSDEFAKIYHGKIYLYWDDTNPEKCKDEFVQGIKTDTDWLGISFSKEYFASDSIEKIYDYGREMLRQGNAYICSCHEDDIKAKRFSGTECEHRNSDPLQNVKRFDDMVNDRVPEGESIVRLKGDMHSDNTAMRDPTLFRIKKFPHFRHGTKYVLWPTYHMNTPILDSINGVTDVIRSKEYELWDTVHKLILSYLGLREPRIHTEARLNITGTTTKKRDIRKLLSEGKIMGWDDPRLVTIIALRRRGIMPEAIRKFVLRFGMSRTDGTVSIDMLLSENKSIIDPIARHFFFVANPVPVKINGMEELKIKLKMNPNADLGFREYSINGNVFISSSDISNADIGHTLRLKDLASIKIESYSGSVVSEISGKPGRILQWVPSNMAIRCKIIMPRDLFDKDGNYNQSSIDMVEGYAESMAGELPLHSIVQFERFGYCILDQKSDSGLTFIFISK